MIVWLAEGFWKMFESPLPNFRSAQAGIASDSGGPTGHPTRQLCLYLSSDLSGSHRIWNMDLQAVADRHVSYEQPLQNIPQRRWWNG